MKKTILLCTALALMLGCATGITAHAQQNAAELLAEGSALMEDMEYQQAIPVLEQLVKQEANHAEGNYRLGYCYLAEGENEKAEARLEIGIACTGEMGVDAYLALGTALLNLQKYDAVVARMNDAISKHGANHEFYRLIAFAHSSERNLPETEKAFDNAMRLSKSPYELYQDLSTFYYNTNQKIKYVFSGMLFLGRCSQGGIYYSSCQDIGFWRVQAVLYLNGAQRDFTANETAFFEDIYVRSEKDFPKPVFEDALTLYNRLLEAALADASPKGAAYARTLKLHQLIKAKGLTETLVHASLLSISKDSEKWIMAHQADVGQLQALIEAGE